MAMCRDSGAGRARTPAREGWLPGSIAVRGTKQSSEHRGIRRIEGRGPSMSSDFASRLWALGLAMTTLCASVERAAAQDGPLTSHVISGSKEYQSEASIKPFVADLAKQYRVTVTASWGTDGGASLDDLDALKEADLLLIFTRRMKLPEEQMKPIRAHWEAGKPIVAIR